MRFKQHMNESISTGGWEALHVMLEKNCMPYINQLKGAKSLLLRGSKRQIKMFDKVIQRQDRKPLLISKGLSQRLDDWTDSNWGFRARTQSAFTTNSNNTASAYGSSYLMFPIGDFKYAWNDDVSELYSHYDGYAVTVSGIAMAQDRNNIPHSERPNAYKQAFEENILPELKNYQVNQGLNTYLKKRSWDQRGYSECIVNCKSYYMINREWDTTLLAWYSDRYWRGK